MYSVVTLDFDAFGPHEALMIQDNLPSEELSLEWARVRLLYSSFNTRITIHADERKHCPIYRLFWKDRKPVEVKLNG